VSLDAAANLTWAHEPALNIDSPWRPWTHGSGTHFARLTLITRVTDFPVCQFEDRRTPALLAD